MIVAELRHLQPVNWVHLTYLHLSSAKIQENAHPSS